jgi:hypothetical protein
MVIDTSLAPPELRASVEEFWPMDQVDNALRIAYLESGWNAFADRDTTTADIQCGDKLGEHDGVSIYAEHSVGYFQINVCNFPSWDWHRLVNAEQNCGTAHMLWSERGWQPWYFSAKALGLLP